MEAAEAHLSLHLSTFHIVGNLMHWLIIVIFICLSFCNMIISKHRYWSRLVLQVINISFVPFLSYYALYLYITQRFTGNSVPISKSRSILWLMKLFIIVVHIFLSDQGKDDYVYMQKLNVWRVWTTSQACQALTNQDIYKRQSNKRKRLH